MTMTMTMTTMGRIGGRGGEVMLMVIQTPGTDASRRAKRQALRDSDSATHGPTDTTLLLGSNPDIVSIDFINCDTSDLSTIGL